MDVIFCRSGRPSVSAVHVGEGECQSRDRQRPPCVPMNNALVPTTSISGEKAIARTCPDVAPDKPSIEYGPMDSQLKVFIPISYKGETRSRSSRPTICYQNLGGLHAA